MFCKELINIISQLQKSFINDVEYSFIKAINLQKTNITKI